MKDWIDKLRLVLTLNERNILEHAGQISHQLALEKATREYDQYKEELRKIEHLNSIKELDQDIKKLRGGNSKA